MLVEQWDNAYDLINLYDACKLFVMDMYKLILMFWAIDTNYN